MNKIISNKYTILFLAILLFNGCSKDFLELEPRGTRLETNFYQTEEEIFQALVSAYDVLQWNGTNGWTMKMGLLNTASDECFAGGSDASDQPSWVAYDNFTLDANLGPQSGLWNKGFTGIYRANLVLQKVGEAGGLSETFKARTIAEAKFLRAYYYFDLVRFFGNAPLITNVLSADEIYTQTQNPASEIYTQIEQDLQDAKGTFDLPSTLPPDELGRITQGAVAALLGKVILYQNDESRMSEAGTIFEEVINSGVYALEPNFANIFRQDNEFGIESVFEIQYSGNQRGGWDNFGNGTEGNYDVQFMGMRDYVGPSYSVGYGFCPVSEKLVTALQNDPRLEHTIIDANELLDQGASYSPGYQDTGYFIRKYAGLQQDQATDGEVALNWAYNYREIRLADVLLMAAEAFSRAGNDDSAKEYLNRVRQRAGVSNLFTISGAALLEAIYTERQLELATEGHRFFDLVRTGRATAELGELGFTANKNEVLPVPQSEIDISEGNLIQNAGY
ncbi:MAG: RagB/SusD family nutrient uptake outer membrane protein [Chitinophagales bacterium]